MQGTKSNCLHSINNSICILHYIAKHPEKENSFSWEKGEYDWGWSKPSWHGESGFFFLLTQHNNLHAVLWNCEAVYSRQAKGSPPSHNMGWPQGWIEKGIRQRHLWLFKSIKGHYWKQLNGTSRFRSSLPLSSSYWSTTEGSLQVALVRFLETSVGVQPVGEAAGCGHSRIIWSALERAFQWEVFSLWHHAQWHHQLSA